jgi:hypothetical protein
MVVADPDQPVRIRRGSADLVRLLDQDRAKAVLASGQRSRQSANASAQNDDVKSFGGHRLRSASTAELGFSLGGKAISGYDPCIRASDMQTGRIDMDVLGQTNRSPLPGVHAFVDLEQLATGLPSGRS